MHWKRGSVVGREGPTTEPLCVLLVKDADMSDTHTIKCAKCNVPLDSPTTEPQPDDIVSCPVCGVSDRFKNVLREVEESVADQAERYLVKGLKDAVRGSKFVKVTEKPQAKKHPRFIVDLNLH